MCQTLRPKNNNSCLPINFYSHNNYYFLTLSLALSQILTGHAHARGTHGEEIIIYESHKVIITYINVSAIKYTLI